MDLKWDSASDQPRIGARIGKRTGGAFEEDADVDDEGADAPIDANRGKGGLPGRSGSNGDGARASSVKRELRRNYSAGRRRARILCMRTSGA